MFQYTPVLEQWKVAYISSIYKKGQKKDPNNYWGIQSLVQQTDCTEQF